MDIPKNQANIIFLHKDFALKVIMDCGTVDTCKFKIKLGLNSLDVINSTQQRVLDACEIKDACEGKNMQTEYSLLG